MKNKAMLKRKCMEITLYTPNIFHLGQEMFTKHTKSNLKLFKTKQKSIIFYLLRSKKLNIEQKIYTWNTNNKLESLQRSKLFYLHFQRNNIKTIFRNDFLSKLGTFGKTRHLWKYINKSRYSITDISSITYINKV